MASFRHLLTLPRPYLPPMLPFSFFIDNYSMKNNGHWCPYVRKTFWIRLLKFLRFHTGDRTAILRGHPAKPHKGPAVCKVKAEHLFRSIVSTLSVYWPDREGSKPRHTRSAVKRPTDWASPAAFVLELALLKGNFRQESQNFYRRACFLPSFIEIDLPWLSLFFLIWWE